MDDRAHSIRRRFTQSFGKSDGEAAGRYQQRITNYYGLTWDMIKDFLDKKFQLDYPGWDYKQCLVRVDWVSALQGGSLIAG